MKTLLENRQLLVLAAAEAVTSIGSWITMMAIFSLLVFQGGGGVRDTSGVLMAALVPLLLVSPLGGMLRLPLLVPERLSIGEYGSIASLALLAVVVASAILLNRLRERASSKQLTRDGSPMATLSIPVPTRGSILEAGE